MTYNLPTLHVPFAFTAGIAAVPLITPLVLLPEKFCTNPKMSAVKLMLGSMADCRVAGYDAPESFKDTDPFATVKIIASWEMLPGKTIFKVPIHVPKRRFTGAGFGAGLVTFFPPQASIRKIGRRIKNRFIELYSFLCRTFPGFNLNPVLVLSSAFWPEAVNGGC